MSRHMKFGMLFKLTTYVINPILIITILQSLPDFTKNQDFGYHDTEP